ncbi:MAG: NAD(P)-dependent oxidoreductase [Desulfovibrionaceae bacterium]|nr:NAD(P)-dependent oxidoreductase [Desulfovibrionaceae bacterium]
MPQRILLTGGTGFVGRHLARTLAGHAELSCMVRAASRSDLLPPGTRVFQADIAKGQGMDAAMERQDCLIHLAGTLFAASWRDYLNGAVLPAKQLGAAARRSGIQRIVVVSSLAATGPCAQSPGVADDAPPAPVSAYGWSKYMAELAFARELSPDRLVVLRPPIIYGPGDKGLLPCFKAAKFGLIAVPGRPFPVSAVHVRDAVQGVLCCLKTKARGVYHINDGTEHSMASLGLAMAAAFGRKALVLRMPRPLLAASAALANLAAGLGLPPGSWNMDKYRESCAEGWLCSAARITAELGYAPSMPLREGMADAVAGYRQLGWL